ncbi:MAG: ORF6N domain-containing protein [Bacteroidota bacterium]
MKNELIGNIENRIFNLRGFRVMIDRDLAELYGVETKVLNQAIKRNIERFPETFRFQLIAIELIKLVAFCDRLEILKHSSVLPFVFTEQGVAMLSAVLKSETAVKISIQIMSSFVEMRKIVSENNLIISRMDKLENKQFESDEKFERIFKALENKDTIPDKGIFFDGQVFDAYSFISDLIRKAEKSLFIIDNYIDDSVLTLLSKRKNGVKVILFTKSINKQLHLDLEKYNSQYETIEIKLLANSHDRFILIDENELYHIGASIKDLGKKWFAFSKMNTESFSLMNQLKSA